MENLLSLYEAGGWVMHVILAMLVVSTAVMCERFYKILFVYHANSAELMQQVQRLILENNIDEAVKICNSNQKAAVYQIFKAALMNAHRPFDEIQDYVEVVKLSIVPKLQERLPYLFTVANTSTLLGLLGTVLGLIRTFQAIGAVEGSQKQLLLSSGISEAMNATAFALIVAVPSMFAYGYLYNRITTMIDDLEHYSAQLLVLLRTGGEYFNRFSTDKEVKTTQQTPKKKAV
jgi:biopolymer transport protein ExbB/TolQ